mmetsp:Transcript_7572/g.16354  ORF Transcript_7572/g.16354 Transcript_7572/m.16354 type:complete len:294 (+) Transcript_7572:219-1100(+)
MPRSSADGLVVFKNNNNQTSVSKRFHRCYNNRQSQILFLVKIAMVASTLATAVGRAVAFSSNTKSTILQRGASLKLSRRATRSLFFNSSPSSSSPSLSSTKSIPKSYTRGLFLSAMVEEEEEEVVDMVMDIDRIWNIGGLRKEAARLTVRCHKKTGKANQRLQKAQEEVDRLTGSDDVTMEELEKCPNLDELEAQVEALRTRLTQLNQLEVLLADIKGKKAVLPEHVLKLATSLEVNDEPPTRPARGPKKQKGPRNMNAFRLPYRRFYTVNKTEIRVRFSVLFFFFSREIGPS